MKTSRLAARLSVALANGQDPGEVLEAFHVEPRVRAEVASGEPVGDALARAGVLPRVYALAFQAGRPEVARDIAEAARRVVRHRRRFVTVARSGLALALATWFAVGVGVTFGLEPLLGASGPEAVTDGVALLRRCFAPGVVFGTVIGAAVVVLGLGRLWPLVPGGRRAAKAGAARAIAALLGAGVSAEAATRAAGEAFGGGRVLAAAARIEGGVPAGTALAETGLAPRGCEGLWSSAEGQRGETLGQIAGALATALEAEADAHAPALGRGTWGLFATLAGALTVGFGVTLVQTWLEVMRWPG